MEIIIRPRDLQYWVDLGLEDLTTIPVEKQPEIKQLAAEFLADTNLVTINGQLAHGRLDRIHFVHRTLRGTGIVEPPVDLEATSATLGVIFVYPVDHLPEEVSMRWELFSPKIQRIPAATSDEAGGLPAQVTAEDPELTWKNYLTNPNIPEMLTVASPPTKRRFSVPLLSILAGVLAIVAVAVMGGRWSAGSGLSRVALATFIVAVAVAVPAYPLLRVTIPDPLEETSALTELEAKGVLSSLLHNVYRSFDHHDENLVYDRLAKSISGELLADVYLETRKSMEVKNQGGLRISVKEVLVTELESWDDNAEKPTFRCRWRVSGWIGHWGHVHRRENEHVANITIGVRDELWKITDMEMLDEYPVAESQRGAAR